MQLQEIYKKLNQMVRGCRLLGCAAMFAGMSPMMLIMLTAVRGQNRDIRKANLYGTIWLIICCFFALSCAVFGLVNSLQYLKKPKNQFKLTNSAFEYAQERLMRWKHSLLFHGVFGLGISVLSTIPMLVVYTLRNFSGKSISLSYGVIFAGCATGVGIIVDSVLRFRIIHNTEIEKDETLEETMVVDHKKLKIKKIIRTICLQFGILAVVAGLRYMVGIQLMSFQVLIWLEVIFLLYFVITNPFGKWN